MSVRLGHLIAFVALVNTLVPLYAEEPPLPERSARRMRAMEFHRRAQERTGVLVPLYVYPADIHTNAVWNRLMDVKR